MSSDSTSAFDFKIDLPTNVDLPDDVVFYMDDTCFPYSWYIIDEDRNNKFDFKLDSAVHAKTIPPGNYSTIHLTQD